MSPEKPTAPERPSTVRTLIGTLTIIGLALAAFLLAIAWSDGLPPLDCPATQRGCCDAENADLLVPAIFTCAAALLLSLVGLAAVPGRRLQFAGAAMLTVAIGVATLASIPALVPCLGE
jgi:hypothetical protein